MSGLMESYYISEDRDFLQAMEQAYLRQLGFAEGFLETFPKEFSEKSRTSLEYAKRFRPVGTAKRQNRLLTS